MAFTTILRRSASTIVPLAAGVIGGQRHAHHSATLFSAVKHTDFAKKTLPQNPSTATRLYSSSPSPSLKKPSSDEALIRLLDSEISLVENSASVRAEEVPEGFPFLIVDNLFENNLRQQTLYLKREYEGETTNVEVQLYSPDLVEDDDKDEDIEKASLSSRLRLSSLLVIVRVSKKGGLSIELYVRANTDGITIERIKYPEMPIDQVLPEFSWLNEDLQNGFYKYLEVRGIKPSTTNFLHAYMLNKYNRRYKNWLKNLKSFLESLK